MMYVMVSRRNCPYCEKAAKLLKESGGVVSYYSLDESKWVLDLFKKSGIKTVPQIWTSKGQHIGGYTELKEYLSDKGTKEF
jgi:glutaredoxin